MCSPRQTRGGTPNSRRNQRLNELELKKPSIAPIDVIEQLLALRCCTTSERRTSFRRSAKRRPSCARLRCKDRELLPIRAAMSESVAWPAGSDRLIIRITLSLTGAFSGANGTRPSNRRACDAMVSFAHGHSLAIESGEQVKPLKELPKRMGTEKKRAKRAPSSGSECEK